jgi:hypothetical protein
MNGVIACGDPQTAAAGSAMLRVGGNAVARQNGELIAAGDRRRGGSVAIVE